MSKLVFVCILAAVYLCAGILAQPVAQQLAQSSRAKRCVNMWDDDCTYTPGAGGDDDYFGGGSPGKRAIGPRPVPACLLNPRLPFCDAWLAKVLQI
ncbi:uncharacterized protein LOC135946877 isoform X2 [Cloeon dipterum]|uniref:uncharacterized protein LOC135946877 isoform X2 n=1 Tax=Cloeon dipterum TaxID=197152 RepID=UPI0032208064